MLVAISAEISRRLTYGGVEVYLDAFLTLAMDGSVQLHAPVALSLGKVSRTNWIESWVGPKAGLDRMAKRKK